MFLEIFACMIIGYLLGTLNPAVMLAKLKKTDLRKNGTGNLGATNTSIVLGKQYGIVVMIIDIVKAVAAYQLSVLLFTEFSAAGVLVGAMCVVGHIYPFYMHFKGGKGLAAFGGLILAYNHWMFVGLLLLGIVLMFIVDHGIVMPLLVAIVFPILVAVTSHNIPETLICSAVGILLLVKHWSIWEKIRNGEDKKVRDFLFRK